MEKYRAIFFSLSSSRQLFIVLHILLLIGIPYTVPLYLFSLISYGIGRACGLRGASAVCGGMTLWLGIFVPLAHSLASLHLYSRTMQIAILGISALFAWRGLRIKDRVEREPEENPRMPAWLKAAVLISLSIVMLAVVLYCRIFWVSSYDNAPNPTFIQNAFYLLRTGSFHFLTPAEDVYDTMGFWYPPLLSYVISLGGMPFHARVADMLRFVSLLGPYLIFIPFLAWLEQFQRRSAVQLIAAWSLIALLCTYSWFRITTDVSTDTPAFLAIVGLYLWLDVFLKKPCPRVFLGVCATLAGVCWMRQYAAPIMLIFSCVLLTFPRVREALGALWVTFRVTMMLIVCGMIFAASLWYAQVFIRSGDPFYPYSSTIAGVLKKSGIQPLREHPMTAGDPSIVLSPVTEKTHNGKSSRVDWLSPNKGLLYNFFSIDTHAASRWWTKALRGFVFSYTIPSSISLLFIGGIICLFARKKEEGITDNLNLVSNALLLSGVIFVAAAGFYYKMLYWFMPAMLVLGYRGLLAFFPQRRMSKTLGVLLFVQAGIFIGLFFYKNVGLSSQPWVMIKVLAKKDMKAYDDFRAYSMYQSALRARRRLQQSTGSLMHFHPEPGEQVSLFLDRSYYWQEEHYHNWREYRDLYEAKDREHLLRLLRERNLTAFVMTGLGFYTASEAQPHLLPKLLAAHDPAFEYDEPFAFLKE